MHCNLTANQKKILSGTKFVGFTSLFHIYYHEQHTDIEMYADADDDCYLYYNNRTKLGFSLLLLLLLYYFFFFLF